MAINEWKIWKKLGIVKEHDFKEAKSEEDLLAVIEFLSEIDVKKLIIRVKQMKSIVHEGKVVDSELKKDNLHKQINQLDDVLTHYDFLQSDTDINGIRLRKVGKTLLRQAKKAGLSELVKEKKKDIKWR